MPSKLYYVGDEWTFHHQSDKLLLLNCPFYYLVFVFERHKNFRAYRDWRALGIGYRIEVIKTSPRKLEKKID